MPGSNSDREAWLRSAREIFAEFHGQPDGEFTVILGDRSGRRVKLAVPSNVPAGPVPMLSSFENDILRIIGNGALKGATIARRLGKRTQDTKLRIVLANMVERGILRTTEDGYKAVSRVEPVSEPGRGEATNPPEPPLGNHHHSPEGGQI